MEYLINSYYNYTDNLSGNIAREMIKLGVILFLWLILLFVLQILIHEGGHFIIGLLTGYQFISIRIFSFTVTWTGTKFKLCRYHVPGSLGQCVMKPPQSNLKKEKIVLFLMGGILLEFFSGFIALILCLSPFPFSFLTRIVLFLFVFYTLGSALLNTIIDKTGNINNDGTSLFYLLQNRKATISGITQLAITAKIHSGLTYKAMPEDIFLLSEREELTNIFFAWHKILEFYYFLDTRQWAMAESCINLLEEVGGEQNHLLKITILSEKLYLAIKMKRTPSVIEELYKILERDLKRGSLDFHFLRVRMSYELYKDNSEDNKEKISKVLEERLMNYPYQGEAIFCCELIREMMEEDKVVNVA